MCLRPNIVVYYVPGAILSTDKIGGVRAPRREENTGFIGIVDRDGLEPAIQTATQRSSGLTQHLDDSVSG